MNKELVLWGDKYTNKIDRSKKSKDIMKSQSSTCELVGTINRHGAIKGFTCLELPVLFIHKPIGEWMCKACASNLLSGMEDF